MVATLGDGGNTGVTACLSAARDGGGPGVDMRLGGRPRLDTLATRNRQAGSALFNNGSGCDEACEESDGEEDGETHDDGEGALSKVGGM